MLNEVKINLDIEISEDMEDVNALVQNSNETKHAGNLQIVFKAADESEGIARVRTHLNGMI